MDQQRLRQPVGTDLGNVNEQEQKQSLFFTMLPLDIRLHIYLQLWLEYGTTQHIYEGTFCYSLTHYPCLLGQEEFDHHRPPSPEAESYDDPGDIDGAIQDIVAPLPQLASVAISGIGRGAHRWYGSPWCEHNKCSKSRASREVGVMKPLLVCKKMYTEASESLYSTMAFRFSNLSVLTRFMNNLSSVLSERIQSVDVMATTIIDSIGLPWTGRNLLYENVDLPLFILYTKLKSLLSNVQELRLCLHLTQELQNTQPRQLPNKIWFEPLYRLSNELKQKRLRKLEVKLVTRCDAESSDDENFVTYGSTPEFLKDAPFSITLVPQGWHYDSACKAYWLDQISGQDKGNQI